MKVPRKGTCTAAFPSAKMNDKVKPALLLAALFVMPTAGRAAEAVEQSAFAANLEVSDIPTASTLYARMFHLNFRMFPAGGVLAKAAASFNNSLMLGVSFKANNVIGNGRVTFDDQPVQAQVRLRIINNQRNGLSAAVGYDGMGYGVTREHGLYGVLGKDLDAAGFFLRAHAGLGVVKFRDVDALAGISGALSEEFQLGIEYDDFLYEDGSANASVGYAWDVGLRIELDFKSLFRGTRNHYRVLKILYTF